MGVGIDLQNCSATKSKETSYKILVQEKILG